MIKNKFKDLFKNYYIQIFTFSLLTLTLILVSIVLFEDIALDNIILIRNIFGTLAIIGFLYSYDLSHRRLRNDLEMGLTRKEVYKAYIIQVAISLFVACFIVTYYMLIYSYVIKQPFNIKDILILPVIFLGLSFLGFFLGIYKMRKRIFYILSGTLIVGIVLIITNFGMPYFVDIILLTLVIILGVVNYLLITKNKI